MDIQNQFAGAGVPAAGAAAWVAITLLGLGLAASSGLNTFLPLLMLACAAKFQLFGITLGDSFDWLGSSAALGVLALATAFEIAGDKIPAVDHALDVFGTVARPAAGALATASAFSGADPTTAAVLGLIIGAPVAFGFHAVKAGTRAASTATTFGIANPLLSTLEDIAAFFLTLIALVVPLLVPLLLVVFVFMFWQLYKKARQRLPFKRQAGTPTGSAPPG